MKISNETKVGALTAVAVVLLILGFDFLKGKSVFNAGNFLYAKYTDTKELMPSHAVFINGYQVGSVSEVNAADKNLRNIVVTIKLKDNYNIPSNSVAYISTNPLGAPSIYITLGNSNHYLKSGDTLQSSDTPGMFANLSDKIMPVADQLKTTLSSLDTVLQNVNTVLDSNTKNNLQKVITNLYRVSSNFVNSSASLQKLMDAENGSLALSLKNVNSFTKNLAANNFKIDSTLTNVQTLTEHLSKADVDGVVNKLKSSIDSMQTALSKLNSSDNSIGALINEKKLYNSLNNTITSLHILMDDLRVHPKRYVNISVFGKKDKGDYLTAPLKNDSTSTSDK
ncbi:MAG: MlaD family protein [Chitinophagaceae bacterium]